MSYGSPELFPQTLSQAQDQSWHSSRGDGWAEASSGIPARRREWGLEVGLMVGGLGSLSSLESARGSCQCGFGAG